MQPGGRVLLFACLLGNAFAIAPEVEATPGGEEASAPGSTSEERVLLFDDRGNLYIEGSFVADLDLLDVLGSVDRVVVRPDEAVSYQRLRAVLDILEEADVTVILGPPQSEMDPVLDLSVDNVEELSTIDARGLGEMRPKRWKFPQNPYGSTDFTAYTLEYGEVKVGLGYMSVGVAPRVQVGMVPIPTILGAYNANAKANVLREGRLDLALVGHIWHIGVTDVLKRYGLMEEEAEVDFEGGITYWGLGARSSLRLTEPWTLHGGLMYQRAGARGKIQINDIPDVLIPLGGALQGSGEDGFTVVPEVTGEVMLLRLATDVRFNRRDSLIFQGGFAFFANARAGVSSDVLDTLTEDYQIPGKTRVNIGQGGFVSPEHTWVASAAYQAQWKHIEARVGIGWSAVPWTWMLGTFDLAYRFGGKTRTNETRIQQGWRQNKNDVNRGNRQGEVPEDAR